MNSGKLDGQEHRHWSQTVWAPVSALLRLSCVALEKLLLCDSVASSFQ